MAEMMLADAVGTGLDLASIQTLTEAAITFTGLAGLVSVLSRSELTPDMRTFRVRNMILLSLLVFFLSLAPQAAVLYGLADADVWRLSSALLIVAQVAQFGFASMSVTNTEIDLFRPVSLVIFFMTGTSTVLALQVINAVPFWFEPSAAPFFVGLCWLMVIATMHFFVLVMRART
ncbi:MAG TPA: hypothetical protein VLA56_05530 [Pseudomonadales bacterium]|nr:hypothetical protein [Pseudomonadales bacterium]